MLHELSEDNLAELVGKEETLVVQYSASWCGNCKIMKPKMKKLASEISSVYFVVADAEKFPNTRTLAKVDNLPTFAAFKNGELVGQVQTNKFDVLKEFISETTGN